MKGSQGVIVAVALGLLGGIVNMFYLSSEASKIAMVSFVGVKPGIIGRGENLKADKLVEVQIPKNAVGNLRQFAFTWEERNTVTDRPTWRPIDSTTGGATLLFRSDIQTPPAELELGKDEKAVGIPIDSKMFSSQLIKPGCLVNFRVPTAASLSMPTPVSPPISGTAPAPGATGGDPLQPEPDKSNPIPPSGFKTFGPFKVLSVGNRLGDAAVWRAAKNPLTQENVITVRVSKNEVGEQQRYDDLWTHLEAVAFHGVGVEVLGKE